MSRTYADSQVVVIGLNEDIDPRQALAFLEELGGVDYANARGGGKLRERYGYRGLPYTVILARELREVQRVYGFGTTIEPIEDAVEQALGRESP